MDIAGQISNLHLLRLSPVPGPLPQSCLASGYYMEGWNGEREKEEGVRKEGGKKDRERERDKKSMTTSTIRSLKLYRAKSISKHG